MRQLFAILSLLLVMSVGTAANAAPCVNIYYDRSPDANYWMGKTYATFLQNLMGHFPEFQQVVSTVESYKKGDIDKCAATIYIGSYFDNAIPADFLNDWANTKTNVAWLGYSTWKLGNKFEEIFGYSYDKISVLDRQKLDFKGRPSFFKNIIYKGETFFKYGEFSKTQQGQFLAEFEQSLFKPVAPAKSQILAKSVQTVTGEEAPYILRAGNHFYVADVPFSFMHEADRYLVFADVLFDILNAKPRHNDKYAFLRIEDVHALVPLSWLYITNKVLKEEQVPLNISLIPIFYDPLYQYTNNPAEQLLSMDRVPAFMNYIQDSKAQGATFIWHGVTHQYKNQFNPHSGTSGDDFEFFDVANNGPIAEDSVGYVMDKLEDGFSVLQKADITPKIWLTPHYQASTLDNIIFANVFSWNVGRVIYYNFKTEGLKSSADPGLWLESKAANGSQLRDQFFNGLKVTTTSKNWSGQYFPYEIFGDVHGQRLIPENLGNSQPFQNEHVTNPRSKEDIVADAKRNLVLRDAWASFFYHPFLFTTYEDGGRGSYPGDASELRFILQELKKMGYKFLDINDFMNKNTKFKRPEPIYKDVQ